MAFNSWVFAGFFVVVYGAYLLLQGRLRAQNAMLLVASYAFYGYWDWRFLGLLCGSTVADYFVARWIGGTEDPRRRRWLITLSVVMNLTVLGFFKYFDFFGDSAARLLNAAGLQPSWTTLNVILPVGISFYTFQALSYTIDVYRRQLPATKSLVEFALYVTFFPQLVAGPIERATNLLPQVQQPRKIVLDQVNAGVLLILWGYFKKVVIADGVAVLANQVFNDGGVRGLDLALGVLAFTLQIYCDFSAYSDIARGLAKLMGFELMLNFRLPYFALSPSDFWQRWHVSLSEWLRDYLYVPLGGNRGGSAQTYRNLALTMLLGGLWHGASWNFVIWGGFHGLILVVYRLLRAAPERSPPPTTLPGYLRTGGQLLLMFLLTNLGWVLFRASSFDQIVHFFRDVGFATSGATAGLARGLLFAAAPLVLVQAAQHLSGNLLVLGKLPLALRVPLYGGLVVAMLVFGVRESTEFIYFQF